MFQILLASLNINRQFRKSLITLVLCAVMVCFLSLYTGNIHSNQAQLSALPQAIPVTAYISNLNGSMNVGLQINGDTLDGIKESGFSSDMVCTVQLAANFAPETPEERVKPKKIILAGVNSLSAYPSLRINGSNDMPDYFDGQSNQCIVDSYFMKKYSLAVGEEIIIDLYRWEFTSNAIGTLRYEYLAERSLTITDSFDAQAQAEIAYIPDIIAPIGWVKSVYAENGAPFNADSASFSVKDPMNLNGFKAAMKELNLLPVNSRAANTAAGIALVVNDETFIQSVTSLKNNLLTLRLFFPVLISAILAAGYVVSNLVFQSRRGEYAIMRSLGMGKAACLAVFMGESAVLALAGGLIGGLTAVLFTGVSLTAFSVSAVFFFIAYMLGVFTAAYALGRVSVIDALTKID